MGQCSKRPVSNDLRDAAKHKTLDTRGHTMCSHLETWEVTYGCPGVVGGGLEELKGYRVCLGSGE